MDKLRCNHCDLDDAPADHFYWTNGRRINCKIRQREHGKNQNAKGRPNHADSKLRWKYGIGLAERDAMIEEQDGKCLTCQLERKLVIDHCHRTKRVRGMLCSQCNTALVGTALGVVMAAQGADEHTSRVKKGQRDEQRIGRMITANYPLAARALVSVS